MGPKLRFGAGDVRVLADETAWSGYYSVRRVTVRHRTFRGGWSEPLVRELWERGDTVGVLPYDPLTDTVILIEQFRAGAMRGDDSPWMLELVAGVVDEGESDEDVAHREALEEAGCEMSELVPIATVFPSAGACTERTRLFCGRATRAAAGDVLGLDKEGEDILVHRVDRETALALLAADRVPNGHTLIALQWLQLHWRQLREHWH